MYNRMMVRLMTVLILVAAAAHATRPQFVEVAPAAGLAFRHVSGGAAKDYTLEAVGGGVAWIDYDRDGWPDLYFTNGGHWEDLASGKRSVRNALFRNRGDGTFEDVTEKAGVGGLHWGMGATAADYDNDGWPDLYVVNYGPNTLYRNRGDGSFEDVTKKAGVGDPSWGSSAGFADYDGDGRLDLYVANYVRFDAKNPPPPRCQYRGITVHCGPKGMTAADDVLYRGNPDGTFTDVSQSAGVRVEPAYGLGVGWADLDDDGDQDLFVANDSTGNFLFENQGGGKFEEIGLLAGVAYSEDGNAQAGMGVAVGDYDGDGRLDLYVTNFADDYNTLYRNLGGMAFRDVTYAADLAFPSWQDLAWGAFFFDFDNDGRPDLFAANGHIYPQVDRYQIGTRFLQPNRLFQNLGGGKFADATGQAGPGLKEAWSSRGAGFADFDNDGDLDIAVNNQDASPSLLRNDGGNAAGHWLGLRLEGASNRDAIGARVRVETPDGAQVQERAAGTSFQASHDDRLHFGLGGQSAATTLTVRWPGGKTQSFADVQGDTYYRLREGGTLEPVAGSRKSGAREATP